MSPETGPRKIENFGLHKATNTIDNGKIVSAFIERQRKSKTREKTEFTSNPEMRREVCCRYDFVFSGPHLPTGGFQRFPNNARFQYRSSLERERCHIIESVQRNTSGHARENVRAK